MNLRTAFEKVAHDLSTPSLPRVYYQTCLLRLMFPNSQPVGCLKILIFDVRFQHYSLYCRSPVIFCSEPIRIPFKLVYFSHSSSLLSDKRCKDMKIVTSFKRSPNE